MKTGRATSARFRSGADVSLSDTLASPERVSGKAGRQLQPVVCRPKENSTLFLAVAELNFSKRVNDCLGTLHVRYVGDLVQKRREDFQRTRNYPF